jgi:orotidine-5'-phosphate decarboxylase
MFKASGCWLTSGEQEEVIDVLLGNELLKWDNAHKLPLKSGGTTDIYVNLRMMRNSPSALRYLARLFCNPLLRLGVNKFVEIPEAVSPLAGVLSSIINLPMVTIREEAKEGRVVGGRVVGNLLPGDRVAIVDDVVTDGASKISALKLISTLGADLRALVVLVDRQQGWASKLSAAGFEDVGVWAGMTLHDVRRSLINRGVMRKGDLEVDKKNSLVVALDGKSWDDVLPLLDVLRTSGCIWKVNDMMFDRGLAWILPNLSVYGRVMVDLKGHDIPNTLANVCRHLRKRPPWAVTVHASGGAQMMRTVVDQLKGTGTKVLAVTVLTSVDAATCEEIYHRQPLDQVLYLAKIADVAGADGFVCSPEEVSTLATMPWMNSKLFVTPGVRSAGEAHGDQKRVSTPLEAVKAGATHLVVGRQVLGAADPVYEVERIQREISGG